MTGVYAHVACSTGSLYMPGILSISYWGPCPLRAISFPHKNFAQIMEHLPKNYREERGERKGGMVLSEPGKGVNGNFFIKRAKNLVK
jgi:hypothetical protein